MKLATLFAVAIALSGCGETDEVWSFEMPRASGDPCRLDHLRLFVTDHGDGDVTGHVSSASGTMSIQNVDGGYRVEIHDTWRPAEVVATLRRRAIDGWDIIHGSVEITSSACRGSVEVSGRAVTVDEYIESASRNGRSYTLGQCSELDGEHCPVNWSLY